MEGMWQVLSRIAVLTWLIMLVSVIVLGTAAFVVEHQARKNGKADESESKEVIREEHGIVTECPESERCAAVTGIMEAERECKQQRKEYDELWERYKNLRLAYEGKAEALKSLEEDYRALESADNKLTAEYRELKKECDAHWRQLTQIMASNPEVFEQFCGEDEVEQELIDAGILVK